MPTKPVDDNNSHRSYYSSAGVRLARSLNPYHARWPRVLGSWRRCADSDSDHRVNPRVNAGVLILILIIDAGREYGSIIIAIIINAGHEYFVADTVS